MKYEGRLSGRLQGWLHGSESIFVVRIGNWLSAVRYFIWSKVDGQSPDSDDPEMDVLLEEYLNSQGFDPTWGRLQYCLDELRYIRELEES